MVLSLSFSLYQVSVDERQRENGRERGNTQIIVSVPNKTVKTCGIAGDEDETDVIQFFYFLFFNFFFRKPPPPPG